MPSVKEIDLSDGIRIVGSAGLPIVLRTASQINALSGNLAKKEQSLNTWLQAQYEVRTPLSSLSPDDPVRQSTPVLQPTERIDGSDLVTTQTYIAVHIFTISPLKLTVRCSDVPIGGNWWL